MKKIFTLLAGILLTVAAMAADHRPTVVVNSSRHFRIVIDGRSFYGNDAAIRLNYLQNGFHTIKVYEMRRGLFVKGEKLVTHTTFKLGRKDVRIKIDNFGRVQITKMNSDRRYNDRDWNKYDRDDDRDRNRHDRDDDDDRGNGRRF